jgi:uncharacterized protein DUF3551
MRHVSLVVLAAISALSAMGTVAPAAAEAVQDSYCLQGTNYGYPGNCQYSSYPQCMASASGTMDGCGINPMYAYAQPARPAVVGKRNPR